MSASTVGSKNVRPSACRLPPSQDASAFGNRILNMILNLLNCRKIDQRSLQDALGSRSISNLERSTAAASFGGEFIVNARLNIQSGSRKQTFARRFDTWK